MSNSISTHDETEPDPLTGESGDHTPLSLRWDTKKIWPELCREIPDLGETGAAVAFSLVVEAKGGGKPVSYSRDRNRDYASDLYNYAGIIRAEKVLLEGGYIDSWRQTPAAPDPDPKVVRMRSAMRATQALIDLVDRVKETCPPVRVIAPRDTIVLRRNGREERAADTQKLNRDRRTIQRVNEMLASTIYSLGTSQLVQIFVGDYQSCGRLIADGGAWQNAETEVRLASIINGSPSIEFDYGNTHPAMLYELAGLVAPADSYAIDGFPRKLIKIGFNVLVNASSWASAVGAIQHSKWMRQHFASTDCRDARVLAMAVIGAVKKKHTTIRRFFHKGVGLGLMRWESKIALDVMNQLEKAGVASLPIHDAFMVEVQHREKLLERMRVAADKAGLPLMRIDEKLPEVEKTAEEKADEATHERQQIQTVIAAKSDSGWVGRRRVSSLVVVSESKPRFEKDAEPEVEIIVPTETKEWTISGLDALESFFARAADRFPGEAEPGTGSARRGSELGSSGEILGGAKGPILGISDSESGIADASSPRIRPLSDLPRLQNARELDSEVETHLPPIDAVHPSCADRGLPQPGSIVGMTVSRAGRLRGVRFDEVMAAVRARRSDSIVVPSQEAPMTTTFKFLPMSQLPSPVPAYVDGQRVERNSIRCLGAVWNVLRPRGLDYSPGSGPAYPTSGIYQRLALRTDEAMIDILTPQSGPTILAFCRHGNNRHAVAVANAEVARDIGIAYLRQLAGHNDELAVVVVLSGAFDASPEGDDRRRTRKEVMICLPANPSFEVAPAIATRMRSIEDQGSPELAAYRQASRSGISDDVLASRMAPAAS